MPEPSATDLPRTVPPPARLEPDAIGVTQDTVIGMASSAPAAVVGITLASLAMTAAYGGGLVLVVSAIPMVIIANAYRRLNMWNANAGASFEWVGRAINPYLGFLTGWLMIAGYVLGTLSGVEVLGPSVLAVFGSSSTSTWANIVIATVVGLVMLVIAVIGIRTTARTQVAMAVVEYTILIGISIWGLAAVLGHHHGTFPITSDWFSLSGIGGKGDVVGGFLIAVFAFSGWDGSVYVNEEVRHRRVNPGRAAILAVVLLTVIYALAQLGLQGVVSPAKLQANSSSALVYVAQALGGGGWAKVMALALALSVIATTGTGIVVGARIIYGMVVVVLAWVYLLATSVQNAFNNIVDLTGLLFAIFYVLTALASVVYYRRRIFRNTWDAIVLGVLPLASAGFLVWMVWKSLVEAAAEERWSMLGIVLLGLLLMLVARFWLRSPFFQVRRESDAGGS